MAQIDPNAIGPLEQWLSGAQSVDDIKNLFTDSTVFQNLLDDLNTLKPTDKERIQELLAMTPPWVPPMIIFQVFQNPDLTMGLISRIGATDAASQSTLAGGMGSLEATLIISALVAWSKNQDTVAESILASSQKENIIEEALKKYIQNPSQGAGNIISSLQTFRSSPLLAAALKTVSPSVLQQAYDIAEQQMAIGFLDAVIASETTRRDQIQEQTKTDAIQSDALKQEILKQSIQKDEIERQQLLNSIKNDPKRSINDVLNDASISEAQKAENIAQSIAMEVLSAMKQKELTMSPVIASLLPLILVQRASSTELLPTDVFKNSFQDVASSMPKEVAASLATVGGGAQVLACYWCIPAAISLASLDKKVVVEKKIPESAVKAYALTLASLVNNPSFLKLIDHVILRSSTDPKSMTDEKVAAWRSMLIMALLTNALSALYKITTGHLTKEEIHSMLTGKMSAEPGIQQALVTMIREELKNIPEEEQQEVLERLLAHLDQNPKLENLMDPAQTFLKFCTPDLSYKTASAEEA